MPFEVDGGDDVGPNRSGGEADDLLVIGGELGGVQAVSLGGGGVEDDPDVIEVGQANQAVEA
jgi:hypothetical protein